MGLTCSMGRPDGPPSISQDASTRPGGPPLRSAVPFGDLGPFPLAVEHFETGGRELDPLLLEGHLDGPKPTPKLAVGLGQGGLGIEIEMARQVGHREEQVTDCTGHAAERFGVVVGGTALVERDFYLRVVRNVSG